jgi:hypothetical protein
MMLGFEAEHLGRRAQNGCGYGRAIRYNHVNSRAAALTISGARASLNRGAHI